MANGALEVRASVKIRAIHKMSDEFREGIVSWLRTQADRLEREHETLADNYAARWFDKPKEN